MREITKFGIMEWIVLDFGKGAILSRDDEIGLATSLRYLFDITAATRGEDDLLLKQQHLSLAFANVSGVSAHRVRAVSVRLAFRSQHIRVSIISLCHS